MPKTRLDKKEIEHLASLAGLELTLEEIKKYQDQLSETLEYIENLKELDTSQIPTTTSPINSSSVYFEDGENCNRLLSEKEVFQNAKNKSKDYFSVKKIL